VPPVPPTVEPTPHSVTPYSAPASGT
jgi:hypothetical protein